MSLPSPPSKKSFGGTQSNLLKKICIIFLGWSSFKNLRIRQNLIAKALMCQTDYKTVSD